MGRFTSEMTIRTAGKMVENLVTCVCMHACVFVFMYILRMITQYAKSLDEYYLSQKMSRHFIQTAADGEIACTFISLTNSEVNISCTLTLTMLCQSLFSGKK